MVIYITDYGAPSKVANDDVNRYENQNKKIDIKIQQKCISRLYHFKFFSGCLPQILLGPFLDTLSHII